MDQTPFKQTHYLPGTESSHVVHPQAGAQPTPASQKALRRLFLTLFLRGRASRGLKLKRAPKSIAAKLAPMLLFNAIVGLTALSLGRMPIFAQSAVMHAMTFVLVGMIVAGAVGEMLFNKEEADILLHRPVTAKALLKAKIWVLVEVALWMAMTLNLVACYVGATSPGGSWWYVVAHALSISLEVLFSISFVVMVYQFCLRWCGRERLETLMTTTQVVVAVALVLGGQIVPRLLVRADSLQTVIEPPWWIAFFPPAWFAGIDDALAGSAAARSWMLAGVAVAALGVVLWLAFSVLTKSYEEGWQTLGETISKRPRASGARGWIAALAGMPPLGWFLRDPVARASFQLSAAYLMRDRDVKLRVYPGLAPMIVMPVVFMFQGSTQGPVNASDFGIAFAAGYLGLAPLLGVSMLQFSQQWQAADVFRAAPMPGPAALCDGARWAVLTLITVPALAIFALLVVAVRRDVSQLSLLLPGAIALPVYSLIPILLDGAAPLSKPIEEAKSVGRGLYMIPVVFVSMTISGIGLLAKTTGYFGWFLLAETVIAIAVYAALRAALSTARWPSME